MTALLTRPLTIRQTVKGLENGAFMTQPEFHRLYSKAPEDVRAELIGGIVYIASPVSLYHGEMHSLVIGLMINYFFGTKGIQVVDNTSVFLGKRDEPQPDISVRILPEYGGQSGTTSRGYIDGAPELIVEVAFSSQSIDLHAKRERYHTNGVLEYLVVNLQDEKIHWFDLKSNNELAIPKNGIVKSSSMPGLWINSKALIEKNGEQLMSALNAGLASPEHAAFVKKLAAARKA